mgnify:CR=1 FL=1
MDNNGIAVKHLIETSEIGLVAIEHIMDKIVRGKFDDAIAFIFEVYELLFKNIDIIANLEISIEENNIEECTKKLQEEFLNLVAACEFRDKKVIEYIIKKQLSPIYEKWCVELRTLVSPLYC